jgi:hypothetical protein
MSITTEFLSDCCDNLYHLFTPIEGGDSMKIALKKFLTNHTVDTAQEVYGAFVNTYRMPGLALLFKSMNEYERNNAKLLSHHRDHYVHSIDTFLIGIAIYVSNKPFRDIFDNKLKYPDAYQPPEEFLYRWGLAALFHDIGYPLELCLRLINLYSFNILNPNLLFNDKVAICDLPKKPYEPSITLNFMNYSELLRVEKLEPKPEFEDDFFHKYPFLRDNSFENAFELIASNLSACLGNMTKEEYFEVMNESFLDSLKSGQVDHGIISSIVFIKWMNQFYFISQWNPAYFYIPAIDAASAIYLHNTLEYLYDAPPISLPKLNVDQHPTAFLLFFCDHLQEWGRKTFIGENSYISYLSSLLKIDNQSFHLALKAQPFVNIDEAQKLPEKVEKEIRDAIRIEDIFLNFSISMQIL